MMNRLMLIVLLLLVGGGAYSQQRVVDSLNTVLKSTVDVKQQVDLLKQMSSASWDYNFEKGFEFATRGYELALQINYTTGQTNALADQGLYYYFTGNYPKSLEVLHQSYQLGKEQPDRFKALMLIRIANAHRQLGTSDSASYYFNKASDLLKGSPPGRTLGLLYFGEGMLFYELDNFTEAKKKFEQALQVRLQVGDSLFIAESWRSLGMIASARNDFDSAQWYYDKSKRIAERYHNPELMTFYYIYQGELFLKKALFPEATRAYTSALDSLNKHNYKVYRPLVLKNIGEIFEWRGNYELALKYLYEALRLEQSMNLQHEVARTYEMMGWVYANQGNFQKALEVTNQSSSMRRARKNNNGMSNCYKLFGFINFKSGRYQEALQYYDSALAIRKEADDPGLMLNILYFKSQVALIQNDYDAAIKSELELYELARRLDNKNALANHYGTMCKIKLAQKQYGEAERFGLMAIQIAKEIQSATIERVVNLSLTEVYNALRNPGKSVQYYKRYIHISDSLYSVESASRQAQFEALYQLEKQEDEIERLRTTSNIQNELLQEQQEKLRFRNTTLLFVGIAGLLLAGFAISMFRLNRTKALANRLLSALNYEVTEQKEEIQAQAEELTEANASLMKLYQELQEKTEEIQVQSEELRETNNMIVEINRDLDEVVTKRTTQLQEAYKELDTFFYRSSHDFRRPLTTFMGLAEVAKITIKDEAALELFQKVNETARSLDKMLVKLQSISDVGTQQLIYKEVQIKEIFNNVCNSFQDDMLQRSMRFDCQVALTRPFVSFPGMIKVILENLVENSIQFCERTNPYIHLLVEETADAQCLITIEDNGAGIHASIKHRIFDMYFRGSERSKGNGLGLYIVRKAVEKLGGSISLDDAFDAGCRFIILLPMDKEGNRKWPLEMLEN